MAGLGFKDFQVGEVLTSSDVDGYLMQQTVMRFADAAARGSALGTAPGTAVALTEGMVSYLDDANTVQVYSGSAWVGIGNFSASTAITATDASWAVPTLADPVVRVTVIGGGGGGGGDFGGSNGGAGSSSTFSDGTTTTTATGGAGGKTAGVASTGANGEDNVWRSNNGGDGGQSGASTDNQFAGGHKGQGGEVKVAYYDLTGVSTAAVTIGGGGAAGSTSATNPGGTGGDGLVIFEYRAG